MISLYAALHFYTEPIRLVKNGYERSEWLWVVCFVLSGRDHYCFAEIRFFVYRRPNLYLLEHISTGGAVSIGEDESRLLLITAWHANLLNRPFQRCTALSVLVRWTTYTWLIQLKIFTSPCHRFRSILFAIPFHHQLVQVLFEEKRRSVLESRWLYLHWWNYSPWL